MPLPPLPRAPGQPLGLLCAIALWFAAFSPAAQGQDAPDCQENVAHHPAPDVAYRPGEDVRGRPVPPADLPGEQRWSPPAEVAVEVLADLDVQTAGLHLEPRLGTATVDAEGGVEWSAGAAAPGGDPCR